MINILKIITVNLFFSFYQFNFIILIFNNYYKIHVNFYKLVKFLLLIFCLTTHCSGSLGNLKKTYPLQGDCNYN